MKFERINTSNQATKIPIEHVTSFTDLEATIDPWSDPHTATMVEAVKNGTASVDTIIDDTLREKVSQLLIDRVQTFDELFVALGQIGTITFPLGDTTLTTAELTTTILAARNQQYPVDAITDSFGIRQKVRELIVIESTDDSPFGAT